MSKSGPTTASTELGRPAVVSASEWCAAHEAQLAREKAFTQERDALAAARRRLPMMRIDKTYVFDGPEGKTSLEELFAGRSQLLLYHFMFAPGVHGWPLAGCPGCSMFLDNIGQFALDHVRQRDVVFAVVSRAPLENLQGYRARMGWPHTWVSSAGNTFNADFGMTTADGEQHGLSVFLKSDDGIFRTYFTTARGLEEAGTVWALLDFAPYGRQETWQDSPPGWPQTPPFQWWRRHDEYR